MAWHNIYDLRQDEQQIAAVQKATLSTEEYGLEPTHGLFGSEEWWKQIADGRLPIETLKGTISRVYMGSMGDWPVFEIALLDSTTESFTRYQTPADGSQDYFYVVGRDIELDTVWQEARRNAPDWGLPRRWRTVVAIRIAD
jgi:hypothetical protein